MPTLSTRGAAISLALALLASVPPARAFADDVVRVEIDDASGAAVDTLSRTTDQDTTQLFLRGYDVLGNFVRLVPATWTVSGGVGAPVPATGSAVALRLDHPGVCVVAADSGGVWGDSTGTVTVAHGAYAGLEATVSGGPVFAGDTFTFWVRAFDADGNTITDGPGSAAAIRFVAFTDSAATQPADARFVSADASLLDGASSGTLIARRSGVFWVAARDTATGFQSATHPVLVVPAPPDHLELDPDTLALVAGAPDTVTVRVLDAYSNLAPLPAPETLTLWTDRASGTFRDLAGSTIFEVTVPSGQDSTRVTFADTRTTASPGRIRAIDANGAAPFLGTVEAMLGTVPSVPAAFALTASPDTVTANGVDSVLVSGPVTDAFGNPVAAGERFMLAASSSPALTVLTPQLLADASGVVRGTVRAGTTAGLGGATVTAERSSASSSVPVALLAGTPSGAISLSAPSDSLAADSAAVISIGASGLHDASGNRVRDGETYAITSTLGAVNPPVASAAGGAIAFTLFGGDVLGNAVVTARAERDTTSQGAITIRLVPGAVSASRSGVSASSPASVGPVGSVAQVTLRDGQDHPIPGVPAGSIAVTVSGVPATVTPLGPATDANGAIDIRATTTVAGTAVVHVTAAGVPLLDQPTVVYTPGSVTLAPDSLALAPTQARLMTATVRDAQGNAVQGQAITFFLGGPSPAGALESSGSTTGGPGSQSGTTNASGKVTVRYRGPATAPAVDSIFASGGGTSPAAIRAITSPGPTASLRVTPASLGWTAGIAESVRVEALDAFGNRATSDGATVTMRAAGAVVWSPPSASLVGGSATFAGKDTLAESFAVAADRAGGGTGSGGTAVVAPAAPSGAIAIAATRDTLTADGRSASTVTLGPARDAFGNLVGAGALIGVSANTGTLVAPDASALYPGLDLATAADSRASVVLIAASSAGPDTLRAAARAGSAAGAHAFVYLPAPSLAYVAGTLAPLAVTPGGAAAFSLDARNTGPGTLSLAASTTLSFGSGPSAFQAALASPVAIAPGATATLSFASGTVPASLPPGSYAPSLRASGTDGTGASFDFHPSLAGAQVSVLGVGVAPVSAAPDPAPLGGSLTLVFDVTNVSGTPGDLTGATIGYSAGAFLTGSPAPPLGTVIPAGATTRFSFPVQAPSSGLAPGSTVNATLQATLTYGGSPVSGITATPLSFHVVSAAQITAVAGSGAPARLLRGRTAGLSVRVSDSGAAAVTLSRGTTRLALDLGGATLTTGLSAATAVNSGEQATLAFDSLAVPALTPKGRYRARLFLDGVESGQAFADTVAFAPDSLDVVDPAILSVVSGSLQPATVSAGQARPVAITLRNDGDVPFGIDGASTLRFGAPVTTTLALGSAPALSAGGSVTLTFSGGALGTPGAPGDAAATLDLLGVEDGVPRAQSLPADTLHARAPAALQYVARSTAPAQARPGQTIDVTLDVRNAGGSPVTVDPASSRIGLSDGTDLATAPGSGATVVIAPSSSATLSFPALAIPASMASQPYHLDLALAATEWGLSGQVAVASPDSELVVLDPLGGLEARAVDTAPPIQVAPGGPPARVWGLTLTPLAAVGSATSDTLRSVAITVLTDGSASGAPSRALTGLALRDASGALLAQAAPGGSNPVTLALAPPAGLANAPETLFVEASFLGGTSARRVAFRLAQAGDVVAEDVTTGAPVPILGGGGLPFAALTSPEITFFDKPHGYPNPFHAGREAILLSYVLGQDASVKVSIYTLFGDLVREMSAGAGTRGGAAGLNELPWDGRNGKGELVRPGVYVARIDGTGVKETIKVGVLR